MMAERATKITPVSQDIIDRVDSELGTYDDFRHEELQILEATNFPLRHVICDLFETTIQRTGDESARQAMAGGLFASRVLRYAAEEIGSSLPVASLIDQGLKVKQIVDKLVPDKNQPIDYTQFEISFSSQKPILDRLKSFKNPMSRMAATTIFMLYGDIFGS